MAHTAILYQKSANHATRKATKGGIILRHAGVYWVILAICLAFLGGWLCHDWFTASSVEVQVSQGIDETTQSATLQTTPTSTTQEEDASIILVNINTAALEELQTLPSIGAVRAQSIVDFREANGPFAYPEELTQVDGIGEGILEDILPYITTE